MRRQPHAAHPCQPGDQQHKKRSLRGHPPSCEQTIDKRGHDRHAACHGLGWHTRGPCHPTPGYTFPPGKAQPCNQCRNQRDMRATDGNQVGHSRQVKEAPVIGSHAVLIPHRQCDHDGPIAFLTNDALHAVTYMVPGALNGHVRRHPWGIANHQRHAPDRADGAHVPGKKVRLRIKTMRIHA